ncbi:MAG: SDR family NAD(P)-dependent oxidoreductase [Hyphomicrobiales bacterium]|nr:SDR family NAD(P)-dependent oxidoreductase [Hyphomicrobiales bacterium]
MKKFSGRTAFVTGGASGIGLALAQKFADEGMNVALADIERTALDAAVARLRASGANVQGVLCDVTDAAAVANAARETIAAFGKVHILCNNAGVGGGSGIADISVETWRWVIDVNLMGVVNGIAAFLPHMRDHGEAGHIVNTASMAGLQANIGFSPYVASKYAVVGMSEGLALELKGTDIGVSVLCPGFVRTKIVSAYRNRPARYGAATKPAPGTRGADILAHVAERTEAGLDPVQVADRMLRAIRDEDFYVFTHPEMRDEVDERMDAIAAALDRA